MKKKTPFEETLTIVAENIAEQIPDVSKAPDVEIFTPKKIDYSLPIDYPMFDMCYCMANGCKTPCARKRAPHGYCTVSDFAPGCAKYQTDSDDPVWDEIVKEVKEKINQGNSK